MNQKNSPDIENQQPQQPSHPPTINAAAASPTSSPAKGRFFFSAFTSTSSSSAAAAAAPALDPSTTTTTTTTTTNTKFCRLCFEPGALKRPCCNAFYCDHCYIKNNTCPNCKVPTKQEKLTGATYQLKIFSENEECRICLDPGLLRRCCGNYYCDNCYYKYPTCRSCGTIVSSIAEEKRRRESLWNFDQTYAFAVFLGWFFTVFLVIAVITFFSIIAAAEVTTPIGINSYHCYGFFRQCHLQVCIDLNNSVALGETPLPPLSSYQYCQLNSLVKLQSPACIYDQNLYHQSNAALGYDICTQDFAQGVIIFEDDFQHWQNTSFHSNAMKSAKWENIINAYANSFCGGSGKGELALTFRGETTRRAEIQELDVSSGGQILAQMFMPPLSYDYSNPYCRTGYIGVVNVDYSINHGVNWTTFQSYEPAIWRQSHFFNVKVEIPEEAKTNHTRFRFDQPVFVATYDNWALDNVRVLRYLPKDWHSNNKFQSNIQKGLKMIQYAQCCADTDWCSQRLTEKERSQCDNTFGWYNNRTYLFRLAEIMICVALLINLIKFIYLSITNYCLYHHYPFQDEMKLLLSTEYVSNLIAKLPIEYRIYFTMLLNQWNQGITTVSGDLINETVQQIHKSARFQQAQRDAINDAEGEGLMLKTKEEIEEEKADYYKKIKKQQKKLAKRMKKKNFKASTIVIEENKEYLDTLETHVLPEYDDNRNVIQGAQSMEGVKEGEYVVDGNQMTMIEDKLPDNVDKLKRQNIAMLRVPFEFDSDDKFRFYFLVFSLGIYSLMFFLEIGITAAYAIYQPITVFGKYSVTMYMNGSLMTIFAGFIDFKEIYFILKNVIPPSNLFLPFLTVDLTEDNRALFLGHYRIPLANISEITAFAPSFSYWNLAGIIFGVFPWSLFSLLLREAFLDYSQMRFVTPFLGSIMIFRAILGPLILIKTAYVLEYIFSYHFYIREAIGKAMQKKSTLNSALNVGLGLMFIGAFFCSLTAVEYVPYVIVAGFFGGAAYGIFSGTVHELPVKPWICKLFLTFTDFTSHF